jgi:tRNA(fMet)-specific endonuclease VapC
MPPVILDTDILSEFFKGHNAAVAARAKAYATAYAVFSFTSVTVYDILYGLQVKGADTQRLKVLNWMQQNEEITPLSADYRVAANIKATARAQGSIVELPDCLIAATALRLNRPLVTGNTKDFEAIQRTGVSLVLENWRVTL